MILLGNTTLYNPERIALISKEASYIYVMLNNGHTFNLSCKLDKEEFEEKVHEILSRLRKNKKNIIKLNDSVIFNLDLVESSEHVQGEESKGVYFILSTKNSVFFKADIDDSDYQLLVRRIIKNKGLVNPWI